MANRLVVAGALLAALLLPGCGQTRQDYPVGSPQPQAETKVKFEQYQSSRYRYTIRYPAGWYPGGSHQGDYLTISKPSPPDVGDPSIRVFITETDSDKGLNMKPPTKEQLVGPGDWPHMSADSAEETRVLTAHGEVPGYVVRGRGTTRGVPYGAIGLDVYGSGHSVEVVCSSAEAEWSQWEAVCEEVIRTFVAGDLNASRDSGSTKPSMPENSLAVLRDRASSARPDHTFPLPKTGNLRDSVAPAGAVVWSDAGWPSALTLSAISIDTGTEAWRRQYGSSTVSAAAVAEGTAVYADGSGLEVIGPTGKALIKQPSVGPAHLSVGEHGRRMYLVERPNMQPAVRYLVIKPLPGAEAETVTVDTPFDSFEPAAGSDAVLLGCPNLRLQRGQSQVWVHQMPVCAIETGISDDGLLAFGVLDQGGSEVIRTLGQDGSLLWERSIRRGEESFLFAAGGKRFWFLENDQPDDKPHLRVVDARGTVLSDWLFASKDDKLLALNNSGTLALVRVGGDALVLTEQGVVKLRISGEPFQQVMLHPSEPVVYSINTRSHVGTVYRFGGAD